MDREGLASNHLELTEEEDMLIDKKPGQVSFLRSRRKGKKVRPPPCIVSPFPLSMHLHRARPLLPPTLSMHTLSSYSQA